MCINAEKNRTLNVKLEISTSNRMTKRKFCLHRFIWKRKQKTPCRNVTKRKCVRLWSSAGTAKIKTKTENVVECAKKIFQWRLFEVKTINRVAEALVPNTLYSIPNIATIDFSFFPFNSWWLSSVFHQFAVASVVNFDVYNDQSNIRKKQTKLQIFKIK